MKLPIERLAEPVWSVIDIITDAVLESGMTHDAALDAIEKHIDAGHVHVTIEIDRDAPISCGSSANFNKASFGCRFNTDRGGRSH